MSPETSKESVDITERDIVFDCPHCNGELVVDRDGAGMIFDCSHCNKSVTVPQYSSPHKSIPNKSEVQAQAPAPVAETPAAPAPQPARPSPTEQPPAAPAKAYDFTGSSKEQVEKRFEELKLHYKENSSQRTEMRGHINRAQIELHRYQLKLQKLVERQSDMESEIKAVQAFLAKIAQG